jgi:hypothetical protein
MAGVEGWDPSERDRLNRAMDMYRHRHRRRIGNITGTTGSTLDMKVGDFVDKLMVLLGCQDMRYVHHASESF